MAAKGRRVVAVALAAQPVEGKEPLTVATHSVVALLAAACLSLFGFAMPSPILPVLRDRFGLSAGEVGLVSSSFAAGMFFAVMLLPAISDSRGRRPVLIAALTCNTVGFLAQGLVLSLRLSFSAFLLVRFVTGLFAGCNPVFKAYLADAVPATRLPEFMVYREAAATLAFVVGPTLGGLLAAGAGPAGPLYAAAAANALGALIVAARVQESNIVREAAVTGRQSGELQEAAAQGKEALPWLLVTLVLGMSFLYVVCQTCWASFLPLLMDDRFGASPYEIGLVTTKVSVVVLFFQVLCYKPVMRRIGLELMGAFGALAILVGLAGLGWPAMPFWAAAAAYAVGVASFPATIPTLLAGLVPRSRRGLVLGIDSIVNNLCRVVAPIGLGLLYARSPGHCFGAASAVMLFEIVVLVAMWFRGARRSGWR